MDEYASTTVDDIDEPAPQKPSGRAVFLVVEGANKGERLELPMGSCRALGRSIDEEERTKLLNSGSMVSLDDFSKKLVFSYITTHFGQKGTQSAGGSFAGFKREPDFVLVDKSISRLHAILFYDQVGIGILDLVSKNGTFVNGAEIESKLLKEGDVITVGTSKLKVEGVLS